MPYKLRKAPKRELYWVVNKESGKKYSKEPLPRDKAIAQMKALYVAEKKEGSGKIRDYERRLARLQEQLDELNKSADPATYEDYDEDDEETDWVAKTDAKFKELARALDWDKFLPDDLKTRFTTLKEAIEGHSADELNDDYGELVEIAEAYKAIKPKFSPKDILERQLTGEGLFDGIKSVANTAWDWTKKAVNEVVNPDSIARRRISDVSKGVRKDYPPSARKMISQYGNCVITNVVIRRDPIQSFIHKAFNVLSFGLWDKARKDSNYDKLFHLGVVLTLRCPNNSTTQLLVEKNEVINIQHPKKLERDTQLLQVFAPSAPMTLNTFLENARQRMGDNYFTYDPFQNNCQDFIANLLDSSSIYPPYAKSFVKQDVDSIVSKLPGYIAPVARAITDIGAVANVALEGGTHREDFFKKHNLSPSMKPSLAKVSKISGVPKHILQEVYNRGIGAYKTQPKSVRLKDSFVKNVDAPMKKKLSKEQWAWARVYSFLMGNPKHDNDLRANIQSSPKKSASKKKFGLGRPGATPLSGGADPTPFTGLGEWEMTWSQWSRAGLGGEVISNTTLPQLQEYVNSLTKPQQVWTILHKIIQQSPTLKNGGGLSDQAFLEQQLKGVDDYYGNKKTALAEYNQEASEMVQYMKEAIIQEYQDASEVLDAVKGGNPGLIQKGMETAGAVANAMSEIAQLASPSGMLMAGIDIFTSLLSTVFSADFHKPTPITDYKYHDQLATDMGRIAGSLGSAIGSVIGRVQEAFGAKSQAEQNMPYVESVVAAKYKHSIELINTFQEALKNEVAHKMKYYSDAAEAGKKNRKDIADQVAFQRATHFMDRQGEDPITFEEWDKAGRPKHYYKHNRPKTPEQQKAFDEEQKKKQAEIHKAVYGWGKGGGIEAYLKKIGYDPSAYLKEARRRAKQNGYPEKLLGFSDDAIHKLQIPDTEGRIVRFGRVGNNDHLIWSYLEAEKKAPSGTSQKKQNTFHKSHSKIKGNWKANPFSPNNLALKILW